jgi:hypothetical protein
MGFKEQIKKFYLEHTPGATVEENLLKAPCPFCSSGETEKPAMMVVCLNPESYFFGSRPLAPFVHPGKLKSPQ